MPNGLFGAALGVSICLISLAAIVKSRKFARQNGVSECVFVQMRL